MQGLDLLKKEKEEGDEGGRRRKEGSRTFLVPQKFITSHNSS
jgi:hypothetical protein